MAFERFDPTCTPRIRGVLFDMDGLVLDTEKLFCRFWAEAGQSFGFPMTFAHGMQLRGLSGPHGQEKLRGMFGPSADYAAIRARRIELMERHIAAHGVELKSGIRELLTYLHQHHIRCAITSSSPPERIRRYLSSHGLENSFDCLCSGRQVPHGKPEPDIYLFGAASLGLAPEECLALEDAPAGLEAACRAGCHAVLIPDLDVPGEEILRRCFGRADSLVDIIGLLEALK